MRPASSAAMLDNEGGGSVDIEMRHHASAGEDIAPEQLGDPCRSLEADDRNSPQCRIDGNIRQRIQPRTEKEDIRELIRRGDVGNGIDDRYDLVQSATRQLIGEIAQYVASSFG